MRARIDDLMGEIIVQRDVRWREENENYEKDLKIAEMEINMRKLQYDNWRLREGKEELELENATLREELEDREVDDGREFPERTVSYSDESPRIADPETERARNGRGSMWTPVRSPAAVGSDGSGTPVEISGFLDDTNEINSPLASPLEGRSPAGSPGRPSKVNGDETGSQKTL